MDYDNRGEPKQNSNAMQYSLVDVSKAITTRRPSCFNHLKCFVVNYNADNEFPHKFYYSGCSDLRSNGTYCAKASCHHDRRLTKKMFRFQLQLTDSSSSPPVIVTVFDSVQVLLRMSAEELSARSPEAQLQLVRERTSKAQICDICLKVKQDMYSGQFVAVVHELLIVDTEEDEVFNGIIRTPSRSTSITRFSGEFQTPLSEDYASGSSTGSRSVKLTNVKAKMKDLKLAMIDFTEADD